MSSVLIVDDSLTVRMDLAEAFAGGGWVPVLAADCSTARQALSRQRFDVVVLDLLLPDGAGLDLLATIKRSSPEGPTAVMLLSSESEVRDRLRGLATGADDYVGKPYDAMQVVARARALVQQGEPGVSSGPAPRHVVLVVDDSATAREDLREALDAAGYETITAASGEEGLRVAADRRPRAIVVDGIMPGIDGATFIRRLRSDTVLRTTPCLLLTAAGVSGELGALEAGADAYVRKEGGHQVVLARLDALLRGATLASPAAGGGLLGPKRILAIGGPGSSARAVAEALHQEHDVVAAATPEEALELLAVEAVDAILLDAAGPLASALRDCRQLASHPASRDVPVLLVGTSEAPDIVANAINAGADDYVSTSSGTDVIRARLTAQLRRRQFEEENRSRETYARSAAILETISDAFFAVDGAWRFVYLNHAMEALLGRRRQELIGASLWDDCPFLPRNGAGQELEAARSQGRAVTFEAPAADDRWFEVRAFPHQQGLSAHLRDVTERRRSQEVQGHLIGIVGHDLRTPLTAISASAAMALREGGTSVRQRRALDRVLSGARRMTRLINDLLDYSKARLGQGLPLAPRAADLDAICRDSIEEITAVHVGRTIAYRHEGDGHGQWDPDRIQQVLTNLLGNALRYTQESQSIELAWWPQGEERVITVHNDGPPIARHVQKQIFEPFKRGDAEGTAWGGVGLGLYIVREIVRAHGGTVALRSEPGEGTTFTVVLPAAVS